MDPDANLKEQREIATRMLRRIDREILTLDERDGHETDSERLAELAQALDEWLTKGGFLPAAWQRASPVVTPRRKAGWQ